MATSSLRGPLAVSLLCIAVGVAPSAAETPETAGAEAPALPASPAGAGELPASPDLEAYDPLFDDFGEEWEDEFGGVPVFDPFEPGNRAIYGFNQHVNRWVWDPLTDVYRFVVPSIARKALRRSLTNLNAPIYFVNHLLQLRPLRAIETAGAFAMNSTFGIGGLLDTASGVGFDLRPTDFGTTLGVAGVGSGPYLMIPLMGPTTVRDGLGFVVDRAFHPLTYFVGIPTQLFSYGGFGFTRLEAARDDLTALEESALDPYAVLRSAYLQSRKSGIEKMRARDEEPGDEPSEPGAMLASGEKGSS